MKINVNVTVTSAHQVAGVTCVTTCGRTEELIEDTVVIPEITEQEAEIKSKPMKAYTHSPWATMNIG